MTRLPLEPQMKQDKVQPLGRGGGNQFQRKGFLGFVFLCVPKKLRIFSSFIMQIENMEFPRLSTEASCIINK